MTNVFIYFVVWVHVHSELDYFILMTIQSSDSGSHTGNTSSKYYTLHEAHHFAHLNSLQQPVSYCTSMYHAHSFLILAFPELL